MRDFTKLTLEIPTPEAEIVEAEQPNGEIPMENSDPEVTQTSNKSDTISIDFFCIGTITLTLM